jgi:hypothetical protein
MVCTATTSAGCALCFILLCTLIVMAPAQTAEPADPSSNLPGMWTGPLPWPRETAHLRERLQLIALPALTAEGNALHTHQHIDIFINGASVTVPANIGVNEFERFISPLHTHDETGIIHVESDEIRDFNLGQFFDVWGVRLSRECLGGYCVSAGNSLRLYLNGKMVSGDPRALVLRDQQEIALVYGPADSKITIPSRYNF